MSKILILLLATVLVALLIPTHMYLIAGAFLGITWFPARILLFKEERLFFLYAFETSYTPIEDMVNRRAAFAVFLFSNFVLNFLAMLLFWPGAALVSVLNSFLRSGGGTRETRS